jgi:hypothetical protein
MIELQKGQLESKSVIVTEINNSREEVKMELNKSIMEQNTVILNMLGKLNKLEQREE